MNEDLDWIIEKYFAIQWKLFACLILPHIFHSAYMNWISTSRKVAGSIPDVIGFFNWPNPFSRTMALGSTQPLTGMSARNLPGPAGAWGWQPHHHLWVDCLEKVRASTSHKPYGPSRPVTGMAFKARTGLIILFPASPLSSFHLSFVLYIYNFTPTSDTCIRLLLPNEISLSTVCIAGWNIFEHSSYLEHASPVCLKGSRLRASGSHRMTSNNILRMT
jgi:hypothetical protein